MGHMGRFPHFFPTTILLILLQIEEMTHMTHMHLRMLILIASQKKENAWGIKQASLKLRGGGRPQRIASLTSIATTHDICLKSPKSTLYIHTWFWRKIE
jgi:hypothetical protein